MITNQSDLQLREAYARERTFLSLDRTLLSYIRTSMTAVVVGVTFFKFFDTTQMKLAGILIIIVALFLTVLGVIRTIYMHNKITKYSHDDRR